MSPSNSGDVIVFDNLVHAKSNSEGKSLDEVIALRTPSEPVTNSNAAGTLRQINSYDEIKKCAFAAGQRFKAAFT